MEDEVERRQIQQILELDNEELQIEEVESLLESSDDDRDASDVVSPDDFTFNTQLTSLHSYLGEVDDTRHRSAFWDGGAVLNLPLFYLEGVVLFPEATLPLRVIEPNFVAAVNRAMTQANAPYTMGVVRVYRDSNDGPLRLAKVGTTAEIRQYRPVEDGSINVVTRGQQRFCLRRCWIDAEGAILSLNALSHGGRNDENDSEANSEESFENELTQTERRIHQSAIGACYDSDRTDESTSSADDNKLSESDSQSGSPCDTDSTFLGSSPSGHKKQVRNADLGIGTKSMARKVAEPRSHLSSTLSRAFAPIWVYRMYDSFCLAQKAADMWKQIVGTPSMDGFVKKPDLLSFYIASKIPISDPTRQELLEIDGVSYRLRREIELLERLDRVRCKICKTVIARRSDMLVMSTDGPMGAYVNSYGYVHEVMTFRKAKGLATRGRPHKEYSWFPGYVLQLSFSRSSMKPITFKLNTMDS
ncbi:protein cereblon [Gossypium australe]|uniref:Protein cereblon n=1 Tax=Gossypium australe TaxID=47621 RepID=A0A5B6UU07_9ROSI|nr:protein cereblon [Gossypium australe]